MPNCSVACCKKRSQSSSLKRGGISYHTFPKHPHLWEIWKKFCNNKLTWLPTRSSVICSEHFTTADFRVHKENRRRLLKTSIPSITPTCICPSHPLPQTDQAYYSIKADSSGTFYKLKSSGRAKAHKTSKKRIDSVTTGPALASDDGDSDSDGPDGDQDLTEFLVANDGGNSSTKKSYDNAGASNTSDVQYHTSRYSMIEGNVGAEDAAVEEIIIKEEITEEEKTQCRLCLSVGRRMQELGEHAALYRKLLFENHYKNTTIPSFMFDMLACWECHAELRRVGRFQEKVRRANAAFETGQNQNCGDLSNLSTVLISETPRDEGPISSIVHCVQTIKEECETEIEETALPDPLEVNQEPISTKKEAKIVIEVPNLQAQRKTPTAKEKTAQKVVKRAGTNPRTTQEKLKRAKIEQNVTEKAQTEANSAQADVNNPKSSAPIDSDEIFGKVKIEFEELQRILEERRNKESFKSMKYKCESCVLGFTDYNRWQEHNTSFHDEEVGSCSCDICDRRFDDERQLSAHYRNHFVKFVCILCDFECYTKTGRMIHFKRHKGAILGADPDSVLRDRLMRASAGSRDLAS